MRILTVILCAAVLAGCNDVQNAVDNTARQGAKGVVTETLATRFPQVPKQLITPFTDCIIDNSSAEEVQEYVKAAVRGVDDGTAATVKNVLARPETISCVRDASLRAGIV
ncbi:MAG: hypothetical protein ACSHXB_16730 [Sulfitobacter sp.]